MKITESQLELLRSLKCERLSSNTANFSLINDFYNTRNNSLVDTLQGDAYDDDENNRIAYYIVKTVDDKILFFFSLKCGLLYTSPDELIEKVKTARLILAHINEFAMLDIIEDGKCETKHIRKGTLACLFYVWTGTQMSQSDFLKKYYSAQCKDEMLHVKQNTLSIAYSKLDSKSPLHNGFNAKVNVLIGKNQETPAKKVNIKSSCTPRNHAAVKQSVIVQA